jgi:hypothetical protein
MHVSNPPSSFDVVLLITDYLSKKNEDIISQWKSSDNEMAVLSTYLTDISDSIDPVTYKSLKTKRNMMCWIEFEGSGISQHLMLKGPATSTPAIQGTPMLRKFPTSST